MVETRLLHYFLTIAREENITRASGTLSPCIYVSCRIQNSAKQLFKFMSHRFQRSD